MMLILRLAVMGLYQHLNTVKTYLTRQRPPENSSRHCQRYSLSGSVLGCCNGERRNNQTDQLPDGVAPLSIEFREFRCSRFNFGAAFRVWSEMRYVCPKMSRRN